MGCPHILLWILASKHLLVSNNSPLNNTETWARLAEHVIIKTRTNLPDALKQWTPLQLTHRCMVWWMVWHLTKVWMSARHCRLYDWFLENISRSIWGHSKWNVRQSYLFGSKIAITIKDQHVQVEYDWVSLPIMKTIQATLSNMSCPFIRKICLSPRSCKW